MKKIMLRMKNNDGGEAAMFFEQHGEPYTDVDCPASVRFAVIGMRRATDPDPYSKHMAGSRVLRDNLSPTDALKAAVIDLPKKASVSFAVDSDMEMSDLVEG